MRKIKRFVATALACAMVFSMSATAFAAEKETVASEPVINTVVDDAADNNAVTPRATRTISVGNGYVNMTGGDLYNPHGNGWFYYQVTSQGYNGWNYQINCLMYDGNGNVVWRGDNICGVAADGKLEYGGNVVRIDLQIAPRSVLTQAKNFNITVTY
jgi:hypothetical protein